MIFSGVDERMVTDSGHRRAWWTVAILSLLYIVSFVDRFILGLLVAPLKADLGITDVQFGLLFGSAFAIFYGVLGIPLARLADLGNRKWLIVGGVVLWSLSTIASGFATSFAMLVLLRVGLSIGEAALTPATYSLIGDMLPPSKQSLAATIYNACGMLGASSAYVVGSLMIGWSSAIGPGGFGDFRVWQVVFFAVGAPGILLALLFVLFVREPLRTPDAGVSGESLAHVVRFMRNKGWLYAGLFLGAGAAQLTTSAFLAWGPTYMSRSFAMSIADAGREYGLYNILALVGGTLIVPLISREVSKHRGDGLILVSVASVGIGAVLCGMATLQPTPNAFLACAMTGLFLTMGGANNVLASMHLIAPPAMRATMTALILICLTTLSLGIAPPLTAYLARMFAGEGALGVGLALMTVIGATCSIALMLKARPALRAYLTTPLDHRSKA